MASDYLNMIGLAFRAGKCSIGEDQVVKAIQTNRARLVLIASDTGTHTKKKITNKCYTYDVPFKIADNRYTLAHAIGKFQSVAVAIVDDGFADRIHTMLSNK